MLCIELGSHLREFTSIMHDRAIWWLDEHVGHITGKAALATVYESSKFIPIVDRLRALYTIREDAEVRYISELQGAGWRCYHTYEELVSERRIVQDRHMMYVLIEDEMLAIQFKLAMS